MNDKIALIPEKCIAADPEIVELKLGCEMDGDISMNEYFNTPYIVVGQTTLCKKHKKYHIECSAEDNGCTADPAVEIKCSSEEYNGWVTITRREPDCGKPIGRAIHLADVLLAATNQANRYELLPGYWNLRADDLEKQSDETVEFLYELLK